MGQIYGREGDELFVQTNYNNNNDNNRAYNDQWGAKVAPLLSGGFVVIWTEGDPYGYYPWDYNRLSTKVQVYDADGDKVGAGFTISDWVPNPRTAKGVAALQDGGFVITFAGSGEIYTRIFGADGVPRGDSVLVTAYPASGYTGAVTTLASGDFVVAWLGSSQGAGSSVYARRFAADGAPAGNAWLVGENATPNGWLPSFSAFTALESGGFAIAWEDSDPQAGINGKVYDADGLEAGEFQLLGGNSHTLRGAQIASLPGGGFVVTWTDAAGFTSANVKAQKFDEAGIRVGPEILVGATGYPNYGLCDIQALPWGGFIVTWYSSPSSGNPGAIKAQVFDPDGQRIGDAFIVNDNIGQDVEFAVLASGALVFTWSDGAWESSYGTDVMAQIFTPLGPSEGDDVVVGTPATDILDGLGGNDQIYGFEDSDTLIGGNGNDRLDGAAGADSMTGGAGNDVYYVDNAGDTVVEDFDGGTDELRTTLATYSLVPLYNFEILTAVSDIAHDFRGNSRNNVVIGGGGDDVLRLYDGGSDIANAGGGNDNIFFGATLSAADGINGGDGVDTLVLQGPYGALALTSSIVQIEGISLLGGGNTNFGDPGTNLYDYVLTTHDSNFAAGVQARINGAALLAGEDFTFNGSAETDASYVVYGGRGKDTLTGGLGNDIFFFAEERFASGDVVNGGSGYDGMFLRGNYTIDFNAPGYTGLFTSIENLTLTSATDERYARGGGSEFDYNLILSDAIVGAGGVLTVSGTILLATETMILDGGQETDGFFRLFGGKAGDTLKGGSQNDLLHGNLGADILAGGGGADTFRYDSIAESNMASLDQILDFTPGTDKIDLTRIDARTNLAGDQAFSWIGSNAFSGTAGQLRAYAQSGTWFVEGDTNGDGVADLVIALTLNGPTPLGAGDFIL